MYTLLNGLYKYLVQKDEYYILILGLDNAGKTTYLEAARTKFTKNYKGMNSSKITTTVGLNIGKIDHAGVRLNFWDLGGQEELQSLWDKYYAESHAVIYIVDSSDRDRIPDSKETFDRMISSEHLMGVPLLVLANKQDIPDCMGVRDVKPIFNQNAHLIGRRDCMVMPVSALNGQLQTVASLGILPVMVEFFERFLANETYVFDFVDKSSDGVDEGIHWLVDCIKRNNDLRPPRNQDENCLS